MISVVITGGTRGLGNGMAREFLRRGARVTICGRSAESTARAVAELAAEHDRERVFGMACDVSVYEQVEALWRGATERFGAVDIWINNAGLSTPRRDFVELPIETSRSVVETNLLGAMNGARVALRGMRKRGSGAIYNTERFGSDGRMVAPGLIVYGASKAGVAYFAKGLARETEGGPVLVGVINPGMVLTDMLLGDGADREPARSNRVFDILADKVETVAPFLVERIMNNRKHGARIVWLTRPEIFWRFLTAPFRRRRR